MTRAIEGTRSDLQGHTGTFFHSEVYQHLSVEKQKHYWDSSKSERKILRAEYKNDFFQNGIDQNDIHQNDIQQNDYPYATTSATSQNKPVGYDSQLFDVEGNDPRIDARTLRFSGAENGVMTPNGHGPRNELKIKTGLRQLTNSQREDASATISPTFGDGYKSIVAQYHGETSTKFKLYVDTRLATEKGTAAVYARVRNADGTETKVDYGSIKSGEKLNFSFTNDHGKLSFAVNGKQAGPFDQTNLNDKGFFKIGDYEQDHAVAGSSVTVTDFAYARS